MSQPKEPCRFFLLEGSFFCVRKRPFRLTITVKLTNGDFLASASGNVIARSHKACQTEPKRTKCTGHATRYRTMRTLLSLSLPLDTDESENKCIRFVNNVVLQNYHTRIRGLNIFLFLTFAKFSDVILSFSEQSDQRFVWLSWEQYELYSLSFDGNRNILTKPKT